MMFLLLEKKKNNIDLLYFLIVFIINIYVVTITLLLLNQDFRAWLFKFDSFWQFLTLFSYPTIFLVDYLGKSYLFDKDRIKNGWKWLRITLNSDKEFEFESNFKELSEKEFTNKTKFVEM